MFHHRQHAHGAKPEAGSSITFHVEYVCSQFCRHYKCSHFWALKCSHPSAHTCCPWFHAFALMRRLIDKSKRTASDFITNGSQVAPSPRKVPFHQCNLSHTTQKCREMLLVLSARKARLDMSCRRHWPSVLHLLQNGPLIYLVITLHEGSPCNICPILR